MRLPPIPCRKTTSGPAPARSIAIRGAGPIRSLGAAGRLTWGERLLGGYRSFYLVDVRPQSLGFDLGSCRSKAPGLGFEGTAHLVVKISSPARAVDLGFADLPRLLEQSVRRIVADAIVGYDVEHDADAQRAAEAALRGRLSLDKALEVAEAAVRLAPDGAAREYLQVIGRERLAAAADESSWRLAAAKRERILKLLDSPDQLLAQSIVTKEPEFREALNLKLAELDRDRTRQVELMKYLIENKKIEAHDLEDRFKVLLDAAIGADLQPKAAHIASRHEPDEGSGNHSNT